MKRKPWMPDPTLWAWVKFTTQVLALCGMVWGGVFFVDSGVTGWRTMRSDVTETMVKVDTLAANFSTLTTEVGELNMKMDRMLRNDSTLAATLTVFQRQNDCMFEKMINGESIGRYDCKPGGANGEGETQ